MRQGVNYVSPVPRSYPFEQNFGLRVGGKMHTLEANGFKKVSFNGQYPLGEVDLDNAVTIDSCLWTLSLVHWGHDTSYTLALLITSSYVV